jgi:hypothetical protein
MFGEDRNQGEATKRSLIFVKFIKINGYEIFFDLHTAMLNFFTASIICAKEYNKG